MPLVVVLGATGCQGGSVVAALRENQKWQIRAVTRDPNSSAAKRLLDQGVEVVAGNADDESSLVQAFEGATAIFAMTSFDWHVVMSEGPSAAGEKEKKQLLNMARAAARTKTLQHYVMSSLPPASESSDGRRPVPHFDYKHAAFRWMEESLPDLASKTTRIWVGWYSSNMAHLPMMKPSPLPGADTHVWMVPSKAEALLPIAGDVDYNVGVTVQSILEAGAKAYGKLAIVVTEYLTMLDVVHTWESVSAKRAVFVEVSDATYRQIWGIAGDEVASQLRWSEEFGHWEQLDPGHVLSLSELGIEGKLRGFQQTLESMKSHLI
ncbi:hypothetical protein PG999_000325 [Apiospora kogelbergensis]|uniref:NmrA-like domain-containing protein n=1 Tax=Apiospora kogelbergensis TaxID=1337665 RepID=A0AAW0RB53_9PEZI